MSPASRPPASQRPAYGSPLLQKFRQQLSGWWRLRSPREKTLLCVALVLLLLAMLWIGAVQPAWRTITDAQQALPRLQTQAARVDALIQESRALTHTQHAAVDPSLLTGALKASLQQTGLDHAAHVTEHSATNATSASKWTVTFHQADVALVMQWLADLPQTLRIQPEFVALKRASIDGRARAGSVDGQVRIAALGKAAP